MDEAPSSFGKYFLTEKIATGGMAEIYLAKIVGPGGFERFLVIKRIHPELSGERQFVEMFVAEAKTLVSLSHGNIVPIYELGMVNDTYFIAMEYIDGPTLEQLQTALRGAGRRVSTAMSSFVCAEVLKGLDYAHRKGEGVIHRDLSPRNVMLSREGEVKIVDFGIAVGRSTSPGSRRKPTKVEAPTGSYPHMSPEQARGEELDPRSDLFAVGILLWEMLTGKPLFARAGEEETLRAVLEYEIPAPSALCASVPEELDAICARALQRNREDRYATASEFLLALNRYLYSQPETVAPGDISRVVARNCPPTAAESARPRTEAGKPVRSGTVPLVREPKRSGTVPMERPRGKQRGETVRTFATAVNFQTELAGASPPEPEEVAKAETKPPAPAEPEIRSTQELPRTRPPSKMPLLVAGLIALGGVGAAVAVIGSSGEAPAPTLAAAPDARVAQRFDARPSPDAATPIDAGIPDASIPAASIPDARVRIMRKRVDARPSPKPGRVRVAANPWADVYLRGKRLGRAPGTFTIPAGTHTLELRRGTVTKKRSVTIRAGELTSLPLEDLTGN